jgi:uncharacterized protein
LKILAVSDMVVDRLYSSKVAERFKDVDMILGCGDLPYEYLEFLVTALNVPLIYVPGNHDPAYDNKVRSAHVEGGCLFDQHVERVLGLNIAGLGGSVRYKPNCANQYTQNQMYLKIASFFPKLVWHLNRSGRILDIVIAHSPPRGIHDDIDKAHIGFKAFRDFIRVVKPRYFLHGHTIVYKGNVVPPVTQVGETTVINVYPYYILEI